jgi:bifunctional non-homologous end joining protein LigD
VITDLPAGVRGLLRDEPFPDWVSPMLATLTDKRFSDPGWIFEPKLDGERCLAFRDSDQVRLMSRNRRLLNATYPELADALAAKGAPRVVVDGEIVAFEGRHTSFARLQGRLGITEPELARATGIPVFYYIFDLLHLDGKATTELPLIWRKRLLRKAFEFHDPLRYTTYRLRDGEAAYRAACERGDEGVMAKLADSKYEGRRSPNWLKFKCVRDQEFVIGGYTAPKGSRVGLGALLVGYH